MTVPLVLPPSLKNRYRFPVLNLSSREKRWKNLRRWEKPTEPVEEVKAWKLLSQLFRPFWTPETLQAFYESIDWSELPADTNLLRVEFILHPQATPELLHAVSESYRSPVYLHFTSPRNVLAALLTSPLTSQAHLIQLAGRYSWVEDKYAIANHPNSDFEVWKVLYLSPTRDLPSPRLGKNLVRLPGFEEGVREEFRHQGKDQLSDLPLEWLLELWKMENLERRPVS